MTGVLHTLLLLAIAIDPSDSPPATGAEAAVPQEALPPPSPPPCIPTAPTVTPQPQATPRPCHIVADESPAPRVPAEGPADVSWIQASHDLLERGINALVLKLDRFFGEPAHDPFEPPTSHVRLRNEVRTGQDDSLQAGTSVAGHLRLPTANRVLARLRLLFTGETQPKPLPGPDVDLVPPRFHARVQPASGGLELRVDLARARRTLLDVGGGARFGIPPPPFVRARLAQGFPLGVSVVGHLNQSLFWDRREGFGETSRLDVERAFGIRTLARWWSIGTVDEVSRGYEWASEIGLQRVLGARTGLYAAAAIAGATRPTAHVDRYRVYTRLRRDVYAGWAFVEVEPEIAWPADEVTSRRSRVLAVTLRLELQVSTDGLTPTPLASARAPEPPT
jgi:hypothetical protein